MSDFTKNTKQKKNIGSLTCPLCGEQFPRLIYDLSGERNQPLLNSIQEETPNWKPEQGICPRCLNRHYQLCLNTQLPAVSKGESEFQLLPIAVQLQANPEIKGKGITICFIDSGIYFHPDLVQPVNRIKFALDITNPKMESDYFRQPHPNNWHGTMTTSVCAGNGFLSNGRYKGVASEAEIVLLKVMDEAGKISGENIVKALEWIGRNHQKYGIRIVNLSVTDDEPISFHTSKIDLTAKALVKKGIVIVAAVGNDPEAAINPPANAPELLAVGGLDDHNSHLPLQYSIYHSTYGWTIDGILKPDLIAPAIWIPAPILPHTPEQQRATLLFKILQLPNDQVVSFLRTNIAQTGLSPELLSQNSSIIKQEIVQFAHSLRLLSPDYMEVDGTSFAAPITCSVIAQMLEVQPTLTPETVREILLSTARRIPNVEAIKQGYGVLQSASAVAFAGKEANPSFITYSPVINYLKKKIRFRLRASDAHKIVLTGDFVKWAPDKIYLKEISPGIWETVIEILPPGVYQYRYIKDENNWISDPANIYRQPNEFNSFNSLFFIDD